MAQSKPLSQPAILIVEDEVLIRMQLASIVEEAGFTVFEAGTADEAIQIMEVNESINVLMTDISMPGSMDGLKLSHFVKKRWPPIKIVVASGHLKVGRHDLPDQDIFLEKPYNTPRLRQLLDEIVADFNLPG